MTTSMPTPWGTTTDPHATCDRCGRGLETDARLCEDCHETVARRRARR